MNKLIVIGWTGTKICYLNVSKEEAVKRYLAETGVDLSKEELNKVITEFEFTDSFLAYDAYSK